MQEAILPELSKDEFAKQLLALLGEGAGDGGAGGGDGFGSAERDARRLRNAYEELCYDMPGVSSQDAGELASYLAAAVKRGDGATLFGADPAIACVRPFCVGVATEAAEALARATSAKAAAASAQAQSAEAVVAAQEASAYAAALASLSAVVLVGAPASILGGARVDAAKYFGEGESAASDGASTGEGSEASVAVACDLIGMLGVGGEQLRALGAAAAIDVDDALGKIIAGLAAVAADSPSLSSSSSSSSSSSTARPAALASAMASACDAATARMMMVATAAAAAAASDSNKARLWRFTAPQQPPGAGAVAAAGLASSSSSASWQRRRQQKRHASLLQHIYEAVVACSSASTGAGEACLGALLRCLRHLCSLESLPRRCELPLVRAVAAAAVVLAPRIARASTLCIVSQGTRSIAGSDDGVESAAARAERMRALSCIDLAAWALEKRGAEDEDAATVTLALIRAGAVRSMAAVLVADLGIANNACARARARARAHASAPSSSQAAETPRASAGNEAEGEVIVDWNALLRLDAALLRCCAASGEAWSFVARVPGLLARATGSADDDDEEEGSRSRSRSRSREEREVSPALIASRFMWSVLVTVAVAGRGANFSTPAASRAAGAASVRLSMRASAMEYARAVETALATQCDDSEGGAGAGAGAGAAMVRKPLPAAFSVAAEFLAHPTIRAGLAKAAATAAAAAAVRLGTSHDDLGQEGKGGGRPDGATSFFQDFARDLVGTAVRRVEGGGGGAEDEREGLPIVRRLALAAAAAHRAEVRRGNRLPAKAEGSEAPVATVAASAVALATAGVEGAARGSKAQSERDSEDELPSLRGTHSRRAALKRLHLALKAALEPPAEMGSSKRE